jgi:hypothetical protein
VATAISASSGSTVQYVEWLGDAVTREPGGNVVPMRLLGDEAERSVAEELARMGFELIYQSRASRGAFDLLAIRGTHLLGIRVKRSALPLRFGAASWNRMAADAERLGWRSLVAVRPPGEREPRPTAARGRRSGSAGRPRAHGARASGRGRGARPRATGTSFTGPARRSPLLSGALSGR